jgi:hypothetical protein
MVDLIGFVTATRRAIRDHDRIAAVTAHVAKLPGSMAAHVEGVRGADGLRRERRIRHDGLRLGWVEPVSEKEQGGQPDEPDLGRNHSIPPKPVPR